MREQLIELILKPRIKHKQILDTKIGEDCTEDWTYGISAIQ